MMKLVLCFLFLGLASCETGDVNQNSSLIFTPSAEKAIVVPTAKYSCFDLVDGELDSEGLSSTPAVKANSAVWNNIHFEWNDPSRTLYIAYISLEFNSPLFQSGKYTYVLSADEVNSLLGVAAGTIAPSTVLDTNNKAGASSTAGLVNCGLNAGSISLVDGAFGTARGVIKVAATAVDPSTGAEEFIKTTTSVSLQVEDF